MRTLLLLYASSSPLSIIRFFFANNNSISRTAMRSQNELRRSPRFLKNSNTVDLSRFAYVPSTTTTVVPAVRTATTLSASPTQSNDDFTSNIAEIITRDNANNDNDGDDISSKKSPPRTPSSRNKRNGRPNAPPSTPPPTKKQRSPRKSAKSKIDPGSLKPPKEWKNIYTLVEELRADRSAPVDNDGAEALPQRDRGESVYRFQVLIALMLSSQTKDAVVGDAIRKLQKHGLDVENIRATSPEVLNKLIYSVGFRNNKTKYIKNAAETIAMKYNGDIPPNADELMTLAGVGPKMAYIVESIAFNTTSGIGVDTHMHRMFNQLKWVNSKTPEQTRKQLEGWLPREQWGEINYLWVGLGQEVQQQKEKILKKAIQCSRPKEAISLLKRLGVDCKKEAKKFALVDELAECVISRSDRIMSDIDGAGDGPCVNGNDDFSK